VTEKELWKMLKPTFDGLGMATRLENTAGTSVPDVLFVGKGVFVFIELKIQHGNKFYCPPFQWAYAIRASSHVRPHNHWYLVALDNRSPMRMFTVDRLKKQADFVYTSDKLEVNLSRVTPEFVLETPKDLRKWFKYVEEQEYE